MKTDRVAFLVLQGIAMHFSSFSGSACQSRESGVFFAFILSLAVTAFLPLPVPGVQDDRVSGRVQPPLPLEQEEARTLIKDIYAPDYAAEGSEKRRALASKLLAQVGKEQGKVTQFVLLNEAVTASSEGGDLETAFSTVDRICSSWLVNAFDLKSSALEVFVPSKKPGFLEKEITARAHLELIDTAIAEDRYKAAVIVSDGALKIADKLGGRMFKTELKDKRTLARMLAEAFDGLRSQYLLLLDDPDDEAANLAVGNFYAEKKRDPGAAAPFLAKAPLNFLSEASRADVAASSGRGSAFEAGEEWADLYLDGKKKRPEFRDRALYWYQEALAKSTGLERTRVLQRARELRGDVRELLRPLKASELSALVWKDGGTRWSPARLSALNPVRKGSNLVVGNPSSRMFGYLLCDVDVDGDFYARFTVKGGSAVGVLRGSGRSIRGKEVPLKGGTSTVVIERSKGELSFQVGTKKMAARRLGYSWDDDRSPQRIFIRIPRRKICYLSSVQFYREPKVPAPPNSNSRGRTGNK